MILTIRTDKPEAEVGLFKDGKQIAYKKWLAHRKLSATLHKQISKLLQSAGQQFKDLDGVVVYNGPGSFTGLRIGVSVANALGYSLDIPVAGIGGSEDWTEAGLKILKETKQFRAVQINYGGEVKITKPKN
jgi:tRNA threonylcarbamoyladenosine biosynthesis protein TsaB